MPEKCNERCPELEQLTARVNDLQAQSSGTHKEIFTRLNKLEQQGAVQEVQYTTILDKLNGLDGKVDALEAKPGKRWEEVVKTIITVVVTAAVTYLLMGS